MHRHAWSLVLLCLLSACSWWGTGAADCEKLEGRERDLCLSELARDEKKAMYCDDVEDEEQREKCFQEVAVVSCTPSLCEELKTFLTPSNCLEAVVQAGCATEHTAAPNEQVKRTAEQALAALRGDPSDPCSTLRGDEQDHCYQQRAIAEENPALCEEVKGERFAHLESNPPRDKCYVGLALSECDDTPCDEIRGGDLSFTIDGCRELVKRICAVDPQ
jgi:hypothetical protein